MNDDITNYPLSWPFGWERTAPSARERSRFDRHSIIQGARALSKEIARMAGDNYIISTNIKIRADGLPYSNQRTPDDPGVAVYFEWRDKSIAFACDKWTTVEDNLWAIVKHIEALRGQERWGVGSLDQAFAGYAQLPDPDQRNWWEVLNIARTANDAQIKAAYIQLARQYHPDTGANGGDPVVFDQVQKAYDLATGKGGAK
jgi:DnaJ-domain-containing protein 1